MQKEKERAEAEPGEKLSFKGQGEKQEEKKPARETERTAEKDGENKGAYGGENRRRKYFKVERENNNQMLPRGQVNEDLSARGKWGQKTGFNGLRKE